MSILMVTVLLPVAALVVMGAYLVAKKHWYAQACLLLAACLGLVCAVLGIRRWFLSNHVNSIALAAVGIAAIIAVAVTAKMLYFGKAG